MGLLASVQYSVLELSVAVIAVLAVNSWCSSWVAAVTVMVANGGS